MESHFGLRHNLTASDQGGTARVLPLCPKESVDDDHLATP